MKRLVYVLLGLLVCFALFVLPAAAEDAAEPEGTTAAAQQDEKPWFGRNAFHNYRNQFRRSDRSRYAEDPCVTIQDHIVYLLVRDLDYNRRPISEPYYVVIDYFDSDEAEAAAKKLHIPATVNGIPVSGSYFYYLNEYESPWPIGYSNDTVTSVTIDEGVTALSPRAFADFTALKKITLPASLTEIGADAFANCKNLKRIIAKGDITRIGSYAFSGCEQLNFPIPKTLESIGVFAYRESGIKKAIFPAAFRFQAEGFYDDPDESYGTFFGCKQLREVRFTGCCGQTYSWGSFLPNAFCSGCTALERVVLPQADHKLHVSYCAFTGCTSLKTIVNLDQVTYIDQESFKGCTGLRELTIPSSVGFIHETAFKGCKRLRSLTLETTDPTLLDDIDIMKEYSSPDSAEGYIVMPYFVPGNFIKHIPKTCTVYVATKDMKYAVKAHDFKGTVKIQVPVSAPKTVKAVKQNGKVTISWSKVKVCDGYRVWAYNAKTGKYTKLTTVKAGVTSVTVKSNAKQFAVRAYINEGGDISWSKLKTCSVS